MESLETAQLTAGVRAPAGRIEVIEYTDPYSVWCWGLEPAIRRIEVRYADAVDVEIRMGGLFEDFTPMREYWSRMSGGRWKDSVQAFMAAVAGQHRMPMNTERMLDWVDDFQSTYPACIAAKAADIQGRDPGRRYLRRMREAAILEGKAIHRRGVQTALAAEVALDAGAFELALEDGSAERAFLDDLEETRDQGITGFPTMLLRRGYVAVRIDGYQPWTAIDEALRGLNPELRPSPLEPDGESALSLLARFGRCATREVAAVFGTSDDEADILMDELAADGRVARLEAGEGLMWDLPMGSRGAPVGADPPPTTKSAARDRRS